MDMGSLLVTIYTKLQKERGPLLGNFIDNSSYWGRSTRAGVDPVVRLRGDSLQNLRDAFLVNRHILC